MGWTRNPGLDAVMGAVSYEAIFNSSVFLRLS